MKQLKRISYFLFASVCLFEVYASAGDSLLRSCPHAFKAASTHNLSVATTQGYNHSGPPEELRRGPHKIEISKGDSIVKTITGKGQLNYLLSNTGKYLVQQYDRFTNYQLAIHNLDEDSLKRFYHDITPNYHGAELSQVPNVEFMFAPDDKLLMTSYYSRLAVHGLSTEADSKIILPRLSDITRYSTDVGQTARFMSNRRVEIYQNYSKWNIRFRTVIEIRAGRTLSFRKISQDLNGFSIPLDVDAIDSWKPIGDPISGYQLITVDGRSLIIDQLLQP